MICTISPTGLYTPMYANTRPISCISTSNLVWHDTCRRIPELERELDVGFCGQQCTCTDPIIRQSEFDLSRRSWSVLAQSLSNRLKTLSLSQAGFGHIKPLWLRSATDHELLCRPLSSDKAWRRLQFLHDADDDADNDADDDAVYSLAGENGDYSIR